MPASMAWAACMTIAAAVAPPRFIVAVRRRSRRPSAFCSVVEAIGLLNQVMPGLTSRPSRSERWRPASSSARLTASAAKPTGPGWSKFLPIRVCPSPAIAVLALSDIALTLLRHFDEGIQSGVKDGRTQRRERELARVGREVPDVAEGVLNAGGALLVGLVLGRGDRGGAGGERATVGGVDVVDVDVDRGGFAAGMRRVAQLH